MLLSQIITATELRLNDDSAPVYTSNELLAGINAAQLVFCFLSLCYEKTASVSVSGPFVNVLTSNADYLVPLRVKSGSAKLRPATTAQMAAANPAWWSSGAAATHYAARGSLLLFDGTLSTISLTYAAAPPALVNGSDVPVIPLELHPLLAEYASWRALAPQAGQELGKGKPCLERFMAGAKELAGIVRLRSLAQRYDTLGPEAEAFDLSRVLSTRPDLVPGRKERP